MRTEAEGESAIYVISVAAELAGMHPQTLRQYDRLGLVSPSRSKGRSRRYSSVDIHRLREIQRLSQEEGVNLAGIQRIMDLSDRITALEEEVSALRQVIEAAAPQIHRIFTADSQGRLTARSPQGSWGRDPGASTELVVRGQSSASHFPPELLRLLEFLLLPRSAHRAHGAGGDVRDPGAPR